MEKLDSGRPEQEPECILCSELLPQTEGHVVSTDHWKVVVSRDQGYLGRCMIIPMRHIESEGELTETEVLDFHHLKVGLERAVAQAFGARICNWTELGNDAFREEDPKPHLHHHMRPRYEQAVEFAGHLFSDERFGHMYDLDQRWNIDSDPEASGLKDLIAQSIRDNL